MARYALSFFLFQVLAFGNLLHGEILMRLPSFPSGDSNLPGYEGWFNLNSLEISIDHTLEEPGQSGGTEDINIGVGKIDLLKLSKPTGVASANLFQFGINGNSLGQAEIRVVQSYPSGVIPTAAWKLDRTFVASYATKSVGDKLIDEFALYFNRIAFGVVVNNEISVSGWDRVRNASWTTHGLKEDLTAALSAVTHLPGDHNGNGIVDAADYALWRNGGGPDSTQAGYNAWKANFGKSAGSGSVIAAVPEPSSLLLTVAALAAFGTRRRMPAC
jgi:type VI protein secretion system component Hcp